METRLTRRAPSPEEYLHLRAVAGLSPFSHRSAELALPHTLFAVVIEAERGAVGMGRLIGDGGCFFQIVDIAVDPAYRGADWASRSWRR